MENFHFKGFTPSETLRLRADRAIDRITELAPCDARITAAVEQDREIFHCAIEIGSPGCPLAVETSNKFASIAIDKGGRAQAFYQSSFRRIFPLAENVIGEKMEMVSGKDKLIEVPKRKS